MALWGLPASHVRPKDDSALSAQEEEAGNAGSSGRAGRLCSLWGGMGAGVDVQG